jgi:subtilisin family serine protease
LPTFARQRTSTWATASIATVIVALFASLTGVAAASSQVSTVPDRAPAYTSNATGYAAGQIVVRYAHGASGTEISATERSIGAHLIRSIPQIGVRVLAVPVGHEDTSVRELRVNAGVAVVERDGLAQATDTPTNDPYYQSQLTTSIAQVRAPSGWDMETGNPGFVVAVVDSGVSAHPDLTGKLLNGYDFVNNDSSPADDNGHGTMVAGIIGALTNNTTGVAALCWGCSILPVKVLDANASGSYSNIASGITYAADHGAKVINLSLGGSSASSILQSAVDYAVGKGSVVVAASGNQSCACVLYPAAYPNAIAVGAVDPNRARYSYSNYGPALDLMAPGTNWATSSATQSGYAGFSGTSSATPVVASLAALVLSLKPGLSPSALASLLESSAVDLGATGRDDQFGYGEVDFVSALTAAGGTPPSPTAAPSSAPTAAPTAIPAPTAAPTPTPTPAPTSTPSSMTTSYSGSLSAKQTYRTYTITVGTGTLSAVLTSKVSGLTLALGTASGTTIATAQGSGASLSVAVTPGTYVLKVSGSGTKATFSLKVTYPL